MIQDLHSHTYYSFCGKDSPELVAEAAIAGGVELLGFTDHSFGVGYGRRDVFKLNDPDVHATYDRMLDRYWDHIRLVKEKYASQIRILQGIEIATEPRLPLPTLPDAVDISRFDYCLVEQLDYPNSVIHGDLISFARRCGCPAVGIAHTDLFSFMEAQTKDPLCYLRELAEHGIFWELNVNYDSTHHFRIHSYVQRFLEDPAQQKLVRRSGLRVSVGFDGHKVEDYLPERVRSCCARLSELEIPMIFEK